MKSGSQESQVNNVKTIDRSDSLTKINRKSISPGVGYYDHPADDYIKFTMKQDNSALAFGLNKNPRLKTSGSKDNFPAFQSFESENSSKVLLSLKFNNASSKTLDFGKQIDRYKVSHQKENFDKMIKIQQEFQEK